MPYQPDLVISGINRGGNLGGDVLYSGYIIGDASGIEPLVDYGYDHGCATIEYEQDGDWVLVDP